MTDCGHIPPKQYECVQCLLDEMAEQRVRQLDEIADLKAKIKDQQQAIWDLQEMYSELEAERNKLNGELHKERNKR